METMDTLKPEIARLFAAKEARRHKLAALPFPEKVQPWCASRRWPLRVARAGKKVRVWKIDDHVA